MGGDGIENGLPPLYHACMADDRVLVKKLLVEGADPNDGESVYHSAQRNHRECLELLLAYGAPVNVRDSQFGGSPIAWTAHGSMNNGNRTHTDYVAVVGFLLDAGSERPASINRWNEAPESMASPEVEGLLRARGFAP